LIGLILDHRWERLSVQDICGRANLGRSTFYNHFADKEELDSPRRGWSPEEFQRIFVALAHPVVATLGRQGG